MKQRRVLKCATNRVQCPATGCGAIQPTVHGAWKLRGRGVAACNECRAEYYFHAADGSTMVVALRDGEAAAIDIDAPVPVIERQLGLLRLVAV